MDIEPKLAWNRGLCRRISLKLDKRYVHLKGLRGSLHQCNAQNTNMARFVVIEDSLPQVFHYHGWSGIAQ